MTPAKEREHEPTAVKREMTEIITEPGQTGTNPEEAREIARSKGMAKGTAGAGETGDQYEQGAADQISRLDVMIQRDVLCGLIQNHK